MDVTLSTTGQQSVRRYPFNAKDFLAVISTKGGEKKPPVKKRREGNVVRRPKKLMAITGEVLPPNFIAPL